jgi:hypothetical protein
MIPATSPSESVCEIQNPRRLRQLRHGDKATIGMMTSVAMSQLSQPTANLKLHLTC